jgi:hypothetical protein
MKKYVLVATMAIGAGFLASTGAFAQGFHGHRGGSAMRSCIAVMSSTQKAGLKTTFSGQKQTLQTDRQNVMTARNALTTAILSNSGDVSSQEGALSTAQAQYQKDQDALAGQVCKGLSSTQLTAAQTLNTNMTNLRASSHQQAQGYIQAAQAAGGGTENAE